MKNFVFRTMQNIKLEVAVPQLSNFDSLQAHFEWLCGGSIKETVEGKMQKELRLLEQYLMSQGQETVNDIILSYANDCNQHAYESGATFRWVGILRGAEKHWGTTGDCVLFRTELEGIRGTSPQLLFKIENRYGHSVSFLLQIYLGM
jgi:hypothetical protein